MRRSAWLAFCAAATMTWAGSANATKLVVTATGVANSSNPVDFCPDCLLSNAAFTAQFFFDTTLGDAEPAPAVEISGKGANSPIYAATITINGNELSLDTTKSDIAYTATDIFFAVNNPLNFNIRAIGSGLPSALDQTLALTAVTGPGFLSSDAAAGLTFANDSSLTLQTVRIDLAPVPEPATWLMLLTGFAAVGGALRFGIRGGQQRPLRA